MNIHEKELGTVISTIHAPTHLRVDFEIKDRKSVKIGKMVTIPIEIGKEFIGVVTDPYIHREEYSDPSLVRYYRDRGRDPAHVLPGIGSYSYLSARIVGVWDGSSLVFDGTVPDRQLPVLVS